MVFGHRDWTEPLWRAMSVASARWGSLLNRRQDAGTIARDHHRVLEMR